jgi:hypothetical protein
MEPMFRLVVGEVGHGSVKLSDHPHERYLSLTVGLETSMGVLATSPSRVPGRRSSVLRDKCRRPALDRRSGYR